MVKRKTAQTQSIQVATNPKDKGVANSSTNKHNLFRLTFWLWMVLDAAPRCSLPVGVV